MKFRTYLSAALLGLAVSSGAFAQDLERTKSPLRVLFVGHDPESPNMMFADIGTPRTVELYKERTASFEAFLNERFSQVTVVLGAEYSVDMSDQVDVTIFDTRPKKLKEASREVDPVTGEMDYHPAEYLPLSFDRPALLIAENSPQIGEPLGLKLDWL